MALGLDYNYLDPSEYINFKYKRTPGNSHPDTCQCSEFSLECLSRYFKTPSTTKKNGLKILDFGCGPTMINVISAVPKASEIVLAEYTESYRGFVQKWLDKDPSAYDWSPYFKHVVQTLEGMSEEDSVKRMEELRSKVKAIVPCDINQDEFIAKGYEGPYDIVMTFQCLMTCCKDVESYNSAVKKLASLVKVGGRLILYTSKREDCDVGFYTIKGKMFYDALPLSEKILTEALKQNGFTDIYQEVITLTPTSTSNVQGLLFFNGCKNSDGIIR